MWREFKIALDWLLVHVNIILVYVGDLYVVRREIDEKYKQRTTHINA